MKKEVCLKEIAIYLEGVKAGRGELTPLSNMHLKELWKAINYFEKLTQE